MQIEKLLRAWLLVFVTDSNYSYVTILIKYFSLEVDMFKNDVFHAEYLQESDRSKKNVHLSNALTKNLLTQSKVYYRNEVSWDRKD